MKIGIMTFHRAINYGAVLQVYSLSSFLKSRGYNVEVIDFCPAQSNKELALLVPPKSKSAIRRDFTSLRSYAYLKKRKKCFSDFVKNNVQLSRERNITAEQLAEVIHNNHYDTVVCGSDQIWNAKLPDSDISFLLPNVKNIKKISYAASTGKGKFEEFNSPELVRQCLVDFDHISVRETPTLSTLKNIVTLPEEPSLVADPTMLVDFSAIQDIAGKRQVDHPYIFLYTVAGRKRTIDAAKILSERTKLSFYTLLPGSPRKCWTNLKRKLAPGDVGPSGFLAMIRDADYVVTDSFHGAVFSLLFKKNFFYIMKYKNGSYMRDERIGELCDNFQINERYVTEEDMKKISLDMNIDWDEIDRKKQMLSESSAVFLLNALDS